MDTISYTEFRRTLSDALNKVEQDRTPLLITRKNGRNAVVMSAEDFASYEETAYLLRNPKNAKRLRESIAELEAGAGVRVALD